MIASFLRHLFVPLCAIAAVACSPSPSLSPLPPVAPVASAEPGTGPAGPQSWQPTPDAPFRQQAPQAGRESVWQAPVPNESKLKNGMKVLFVPLPQLPIVVIHVTSPRGADQQALAGLGSFSGAMIEQGTKKRSALQVSDDYLGIGADHGAWIDWDSTNVWVKTLPQHVDRALEILSDVVQNPTFAKDEVERLRSQRLSSIQQQVDKARTLMKITAARQLYPRHVYGESIKGTERSVKLISPQALRAFYRASMSPTDATVVVTGAVKQREILTKLEKYFGDWKGAALPRRPVRAPQPPSRSIVLVDRPGAAQSNLALAGVGIAASPKELHNVLMANTVLGGMFSSRLNLNLREKNAFTYGAYSTFNQRHAPGPFIAAASVDTPKTAPALKEMLAEFQRFCSSPVTAEEKQLALGRLAKALPGKFESAQTTASSMAWLAVHQFPLDEFRNRKQNLMKVTSDDILRIARKYLDPNKMKIVIVGDRKRIEPELKELKFGPITVVDAKGKVVQRIPVRGPYTKLTCSK